MCVLCGHVCVPVPFQEEFLILGNQMSGLEDFEVGICIYVPVHVCVYMYLCMCV